jgi:hypothetical protein
MGGLDCIANLKRINSLMVDAGYLVSNSNLTISAWSIADPVPLMDLKTPFVTVPIAYQAMPREHAAKSSSA